jgi:hypothetical protein
MNRKFSMMKSIMIAAALVASVSGLARADDSGSMNMWTGDSYRYFNGGQNFPYGKPVLDNAPSTYRATPPKDALTYEQTHFPYANLGVSDAPSTNRPSYPEDALTYKQTHFPFANLGVSDASASSKSPAR